MLSNSLAGQALQDCNERFHELKSDTNDVHINVDSFAVVGGLIIA